MTKLSDEHKQSIAESQRKRWQRKKAEEAAKDEVIRAARRVAYAEDDVWVGQLRKAIEELDHALFGS